MDRINQTILRFGYPDTLISSYRYWVALLRPSQPTLGSIILAAKGAATSWSELSPEAFTELHTVVWAIEKGLEQAVCYEKINFLMLMMADPHVHFHVLPRYEGQRSAQGVTVRDAGWPGAPILGEAVTLSSEDIPMLVRWLKEIWPSDYLI